MEEYNINMFANGTISLENEIKDEINLIKKIYYFLHKKFGDRLLSYYIIGSIAHGGYIRDFSDIDIAIILKNLHTEDEVLIQNLSKDIRSSGWKLAKNISLFWGSLHSIIYNTRGKFYLPDIVDLVENGILIHGQDIKNDLKFYTPDLLIESVIKYFLEKFPIKSIIDDMLNKQFFFEKDPHKQYIRRICHQVLLPLRFMYTLETGYLGFNHIVIDYYLTNMNNKKTTCWLIKEISVCRERKEISEKLSNHITKYKIGLSQIYIELINLCIKYQRKSNNLNKIEQLLEYKNILTKALILLSD